MIKGIGITVLVVAILTAVFMGNSGNANAQSTATVTATATTNGDQNPCYNVASVPPGHTCVKQADGSVAIVPLPDNPCEGIGLEPGMACRVNDAGKAEIYLTGNEAPAPAATSAPAVTDEVQTAQPTAAVSNSTPGFLLPEDVFKWCVGATCKMERFEQLKEGNGVVNPYGVHMKTGNPVQIMLPAGVSADVWTCFPPALNVSGPASLPQVCEASFRADSTYVPGSTPDTTAAPAEEATVTATATADSDTAPQGACPSTAEQVAQAIGGTADDWKAVANNGWHYKNAAAPLPAFTAPMGSIVDYDGGRANAGDPVPSGTEFTAYWPGSC